MEELSAWKSESKHKPIVLKGCRQCGKTFSVLQFANENYKNVAYINFFENSKAKQIFSENLNVDRIVMLLSAFLGGNVNFEDGKTVIILDEIQQCPEARTALKFFCLDGRFDVIATGSLLGVAGYGDEQTSIPVGYETMLDMRPLDFEEFCWANGVGNDVICELSSCLNAETAVPEALHTMMRQLILEYAVVGGMPEAVSEFVQTKDISKVTKIQRDIIRGYEDDMVKYAPKEAKPLIKQCFQSIPKQLAKENKKFQYSLVKKGARSSKFESSLQWILDAGITQRCENVFITELPLDGNAIYDQFKIYMSDTGLFVSMLEEGTQFDILNGNLFGYKGAIFENLIADVFSKMGRRLYYFRKDSGLELDFLIRFGGRCVPVEVKAKDGNAKSLKTVLNHQEKYHLDFAIKLSDQNVGRSGKILTLPHYMAFLLKAR